MPALKPASQMPWPVLRTLVPGSVRAVAALPITLPVIRVPLRAAAVTRMLAPLRLPVLPPPVLPKPKMLRLRTVSPVFSKLRPTSEPVWLWVPTSCTSGPFRVGKTTSSAVPMMPSTPTPTVPPTPRVVLLLLAMFTVWVVPSIAVFLSVTLGRPEAGVITATPLPLS